MGRIPSGTEYRGLPFAKIEALGNDFIWILPRIASYEPEIIAAWAAGLCDRRRGIGGDGLILWRTKRRQQYPLLFFNSDGSLAEACGNGLRAVGVAGRELGFLEAGRVLFRISNRVFPVDVPECGKYASAGLGPPEKDTDSTALQEIAHFLARVGSHGGIVRVPNPHVVVFNTSNLDPLKREPLAVSLAALVAGGANVGFASVRDRQCIDLDVFERGAGWTHACGTGAAAAWIAARDLGYVNGHAIVRQRGGELRVGSDSQGIIWIRGDAQLVFVGAWPHGELKGGKPCVKFLDWSEGTGRD